MRFEDVVTRPIDTCDQLYRSLGVRSSDDRRFEFKIKPYGSDRVGDVGVEDTDLIRIGEADVRDHIDASVLRGETERLSDVQRKAILGAHGTSGCPASAIRRLVRQASWLTDPTSTRVGEPNGPVASTAARAACKTDR